MVLPVRLPMLRSSAQAAIRMSSTKSTSTTSAVAPRETHDGLVRPQGQAQIASVVSGVPEEMFMRPVRIYRPTTTTMQSSDADVDYWRLDWDVLQSSGRWENGLMGWASSADYMQGTRLKFRTAEEAEHFCQKQGWEYYVQKPKQQKFKPKSYASNFVHSVGPIRLVKTK